MDEKLRRLEREWQRTGLAADHQAFLAERARVGGSRSPQSFLLARSQDFAKALKRAKEEGTRPRVLWGSGHTSAPSFKHYGVEPGDTVFVVVASSKKVTLLTRVRLREVLTVDEFVTRELGVAIPTDRRWELGDRLAAERPELGHALPLGCITEAAVFDDASPFRLDHVVPMELLGAIRFRDKRGKERGAPLEGGLWTAANGIRGHIMRFADETAVAFDRWFDGAPG